MSEAVLDHALRDLGAHLEWPAEVDLVSRVRADVENVTPIRSRRGRRVVVLAAAALVVVAGLLAVSPGLRAAFFRLVGIRGAAVEVHETISPPPGPAFADGLLGERVTQAEAEADLAFALALPDGLGEGEGVYLLREGLSPIATVTYRDGELILSQFRGELERETIGKAVAVGQARRVSVDGARGIWIEGPHTVFVKDPSGASVESRPFLAGNTLLWTVDGVTLRLEGAAELSDALRIARTVAM